MFAPVHTLAKGMDVVSPVLRPLATVTPVVHPERLLGDLRPVRAGPSATTSAPSRVADLLSAVGRLHRGKPFGPPETTEAFVLRMATYVEQLVGGYTLVVGDHK